MKMIKLRLTTPLALESRFCNLALACILASVTTPLWAQTQFVEVAPVSGFLGSYSAPPDGYGAGASAADFDQDGDIDILLATSEGIRHQLYRNLGNGSFEEVAEDLGIDTLDRGRSSVWLDYNGDHRLDFIVTDDCFQLSCTTPGTYLRLYRQTEMGTFVDETTNAGFATDLPVQHRSGIAAGDLNGDQYLDFVVGFWQGSMRVYINQGDGSFANLTEEVGIGGDNSGGYHQPMILDFNDDGLGDIFMTVDFGPNQLWINQGVTNGVPAFVDDAPSTGCDNAMNDMGVTYGDFDGDGDGDFYITNIFEIDGNPFSNVLMRNDSTVGTQAYTEVAASAGVADGGWGWGTTFFDADNDRDLDLAETNGWVDPEWFQPGRLFYNQGDIPPSFTEGAATSSGWTDTSWGATLVAMDYDRDGDLDLMETIAELRTDTTQSVVRLHQNQLDRSAGDRGYLVVKPRMAGPNHWAVGARVMAEVGDRNQTRWISAGISYLGQEPAEAFFGLGSETSARRVTVFWPGGGSSVIASVAKDQQVTVSDDTLFATGFESGDLLGWDRFDSP